MISDGKILPFAAGVAGILAGLASLTLNSCKSLESESSFKPTRTLSCLEVAAANLTEWESMDKQDIPKLPMGQAWLEDAGQVSGFVQIAHNQSEFLVRAQLPDEDIFNPVTEFNQESWSQGDIFEIFIHPAGQDSYFEFHISPRNQRYQLRLSKSGPESDELIRDLSTIAVDSSVSIHPEDGFWVVYAAIPMEPLTEPAGRPIPEEWSVSFSRYDYIRGSDLEDPDLYSSSPHRKLWFHRQHEWTTLTVQ